MTAATLDRPTRAHAPRPAPVVDELTRRGLLAGGVGAATLLGLAGCGDDRSAPAPSASARQVAHKYGTTSVPGSARRVVTLGYTDQEPVLGLGVQPVGVVDFFGERPYGNWAWESPLWKDGKPEIVGNRDEYDFEKIAALRPDLVLGLYSGMTEQDHKTLSKIAPTVAQPRGYADFAAPWTVVTDLAARSLGRKPRADRAVAAVRAQFAAVRRQHPEWKGRTVAVAEPFQRNTWAVFGAADPKLQFFEGLGFTVAPSVRRLEPGGDVPKLSTERLDLLDVDQLVLLIDTGDQTRAQVEANPLFRKLAAAREGRTLFLPFGTPRSVGAALAFNSVLSIPYGIRHVVPELAKG